MKKRAISILLCMYMTTTLLSGCGGDDSADANIIEETVEATTPEAEAAEDASEPETVTVDLAPEDFLAAALNNFNSSPVREYACNRGADWDSVTLTEQVKIDELSQLIYVEDHDGTNAESTEPVQYFLSSEGGIEYLYICDASIPDGYVKIAGNDTLSYSKLIASTAVSFDSTDEYSISDLSIRLSDPYEYTDGRTLQDVSVSYNKAFTGTDTVLDIFDIFCITPDTHELVMRITEIEDETDPASAYNKIEEIYYYTGDAATVLGNQFPGYAYSIPAITYEEYSASH